MEAVVGGSGVKGVNRTLIETFFAGLIAHLIRMRIAPILASQIHESTALILA